MSKTVKELIEELSKYPPETKVMMSGDAEGNDFSAFADAATSAWVQHNQYYGEAVHPDDVDDYGDDLETVLVLWPV